MRGLVLAFMLVLMPTVPAIAAAPGQPEQCATGPVEKTYGGGVWLVASCSDGKSLVFVAKDGSKAAANTVDVLQCRDVGRYRIVRMS